MNNEKLAQCCASCGQVLPPEIKLPPVTRRIYECVTRRGSVSMESLAAYVYADDPNGGPDTAFVSLRSLICHLNRRHLRPRGVAIRASGGPGSTYSLERLSAS